MQSIKSKLKRIAREETGYFDLWKDGLTLRPTAWDALQSLGPCSYKSVEEYIRNEEKKYKKIKIKELKEITEKMMRDLDDLEINYMDNDNIHCSRFGYNNDKKIKNFTVKEELYFSNFFIPEKKEDIEMSIVSNGKKIEVFDEYFQYDISIRCKNHQFVYSIDNDMIDFWSIIKGVKFTVSKFPVITFDNKSFEIYIDRKNAKENNLIDMRSMILAYEGIVDDGICLRREEEGRIKIFCPICKEEMRLSFNRFV